MIKHARPGGGFGNSKTPGHIGRVVFFGEQSGDVCHPYSWFDKIKSRDFIEFILSRY